jgi:hypothetical protein
MTETVHEFRVKRTPFSASRTLTIGPLYLELEGPLSETRFTKEVIEGFRFGITRLTYRFIPVSRTYNIEIKNSEGKIILIRMHSFFEIGYKKVERLFIQIHKQIQEAYFNDMAIHHVRLLNGGLTYELAGAFLTNEGVLLRKEKQIIPWIRIGLASYYHSCSVYDLADPQHFRSFDYWYEWNASLLRTVIDYKIRNGNSF